MPTRSLMALGVATCLFAVAPLGVSRALGSCDVIPGTVQTFRGALGTLDRPFAGPSSIVGISLDRAPDSATRCDTASQGFPAVTEVVITVAFVSPGGVPKVIVIAPTCFPPGEFPICADGACTCIEAEEESVAPTWVQVVDERTLRFRFPDSDGLFAPDLDGLTYSGPARIAVTPSGGPVPLALAETSCGNLVGGGGNGILACVDELFEHDGTCGRAPHAVFPHFTALPRANDYAAICTDPAPPCRGTSEQIRFALDAGGNALLPMDWRGILVNRDRVPVPRLLRGASDIEAFPDSADPIAIPGPAFLGSFSPQGAKLPPIFDPQHDETTSDALTLFGSADAPETILRIARRQRATTCVGGDSDGQPCTAEGQCTGGGRCQSSSRYLACTSSPADTRPCTRTGGCPCTTDKDCPCVGGVGCSTCAPTVCRGGPFTGTACTTDVNCPGGECGPSLFDFAGRRLAPEGPVVIGAVLEARDPVPLEGLLQSDATYAFVLTEALQDSDRNGDGDALDDVAELSDRISGRPLPIGATGPAGMAPGRAVTRVYQTPFSFPVLALDEVAMALLEPEVAQGTRDVNANGQIFETILRAFDLRADPPTNLLPDLELAVDAAPKIDGRSLAIHGGRIFFRAPVASDAARATALLSRSVAPGKTANGESRDPAISKNGRFVAFSSAACDYLPGDCALTGDTNDVEDVFLHDRDADGDGILDESGPDASLTLLLSVALDDEADGPSDQPDVSADGCSVVFRSEEANLDPSDDPEWDCSDEPDPADCNGTSDVFVWYCMDEDRPVRRLTRNATGNNDANGASAEPAVSADGRFVAFASAATNLVPGDTNSATDVFVHDRDADGDGIYDELASGATKTARMSLASSGAQVGAASSKPAVSANGRFVAFESTACDLIPGDCSTSGDTNFASDVFVRDRDADDDGIYDEPAPGATRTVRVSLSSNGEQGSDDSGSPAISADGRFVAFSSVAPNLVPGDGDVRRDVFVRDRDPDGNGVFDETGAVSTERVSRSIAGTGTDGDSGEPAISADARFVVFASDAANLVADDPADDDAPHPGSDVFLHDRVTGQTTLLSKRTGGTAADGPSDSPRISRDGRHVAFRSAATNLATLPGGIADANDAADVFVRGPGGPLSNPSVFAGQAADATVLAVLDTNLPASTPELLCPSEEASVAATGVAFLASEMLCPAPAVGVRGALAAAESETAVAAAEETPVVHLWTADGGLESLSLRARAVVMSDTWIAALAEERTPEGSNDLNGDGDVRDAVVQVHPVGAGTWESSGRAAVKAAISGSLIAFLTPEAGQGAGSLNGDGDAADVVLEIVDARDPSILLLGGGGTVSTRSARDFVVGGTAKNPIVAFHSAESEEAGGAVDPSGDLNGDGDAEDHVLVLYDAATSQRIDTGWAVTPCRLEACDPRVPYRVGRDTVTFLTLEADQGCTGTDSGCVAGARDLNGDGDSADLVLQILNVRLAAEMLQAASPSTARAGDRATAAATTMAVVAGATAALAAVDTDGCPEGDQACAAGGTTSIVGPLSNLGPGKVVASRGRCTRQPAAAAACSSTSDCTPGQVCGPAGLCRFEEGVCEARSDCPRGFQCSDEPTLAVAADDDRDELPDAIDNCPSRKNVKQTDKDGDGVGNTCQPRCGNGVVDPGEACDGGRASCCTDDCRLDLCQPCGRCDATTRGCVAQVLDRCRRPTLPGAATLLVQDTSPDSLDALRWTWAKGQATSATDYGNPAAGEDYALCVFQGEGASTSTIYRGRVAAGAGWKALGRNPTGKRGYRYRNAAGNEDGVTSLRLKPGAGDNAKIIAAGIGEGLALATVATPPLRVQLQSESGRCWEECYSGPGTSGPGGILYEGAGQCSPP